MKTPFPARPHSASPRLVKKPAQTANHANSISLKTTGNANGFQQALLASGQQLMLAGKLREAVRTFETVLKTAPDNVQANFAMGQIATSLGATRNAVDHVRRALKLGTGQYPVHYAMAEVCMRHGLMDEALTHIELALNLNPSDQTGLKPERFRSVILKASILQQLGRTDEAFLLARDMVQDKPLNDDAIGVYSASKKFDGTEPEIALIEQHYTDKPQPQRLKTLGYALGKIFNDTKQYDKAFEYFAAGADTYDAKGVDRKMANETGLMRGAFTANFISEKRKTGHQSNKPIFVVGMPRSGTTLTEQILASHPDVYGVGELKAMSRVNGMISIGNDSDDFYLEKLRDINKKTQFILGENYLNTLYGYNKTAKHYADKMPGNFMYVGLINIIFPNAKIIHCNRDPLDNCVSCYTSPLNDTHPYAKRLDTLGHYYREYRDLMQYWKSVSQIPIFDMPYERTVEDLEGSARALIAHVGLPWDDACLKFNEAKGRVSTISTWQVRQPIYTTSVKRWKVYEKHLGPLIEALGDLAVTD